MLRSLSIAVLLALSAACTIHQTYELPSTDALATNDAAAPDPGSVTVLPEAGLTCETNSDPNHCGACGHQCLGGSCAAGACQPIVLASDGLIAHLVVDATRAFWINQRGDIRMMSLSGGQPVTIASGHAPASRYDGLSTAGAQNETHVFFAVSAKATEAGDVVSRVLRVSKTTFAVDVIGSIRTERLPTNADVGSLSITLVGDRVVWIASVQGDELYSTNQLVARCPQTGCLGEPEVLLRSKEGKETYGSLTSAGSWVLVSDWTRGRILRIFASGDSDPFFDTRYPQQALADGKHVYVATQLTTSNASLVRCSLPPGKETPGFGCTGPVTVIASGGRVNVSQMSLDATHVYWSNFMGMDGIMRCDKEGSGCADHPEIVIDFSGRGEDAVESRVAIMTGDEKALYWTNARGELLKLAKPATKDAKNPG